MDISDYIKNIDPAKIDKRVDENGVLDHIREIAKEVDKLDSLVPKLLIKEREYDEIKEANPNKRTAQRSVVCAHYYDSNYVGSWIKFLGLSAYIAQ